MVAALDILPQMSKPAVQSDLPLFGKLDGQWYHDAASDELWTDAVVTIGGQADEGQKCQRSCARLFEVIVTPQIELGPNIEAADTGLVENCERVYQSGADRTIRLPHHVDFGGVCQPDSHVRCQEVELLGDGTLLICSRARVASDGCLKLNMSRVNREWALRYVWSVRCHL